METEKNPLGYEPVGKRLLSFSVPAIISCLINSVYNIVDQVFIGQGVGYLGNAATTVAFPIVTILLAFSTLIGAGSSAYAAIKLGEKKEEESEIYVIFVTAYSEYAVESYELDAYQYILKEHMEERLPVILRKVLNKIERERKRFRILKQEDGKEKVFYKDIIYIMKAKAAKYVRYITKNGEYRERNTLETVIRELNDDDFLKVDRSCIVNIKHIYKIKGNVIFMTDGTQIPVSRGHLTKVKREINLRWSRE